MDRLDLTAMRRRDFLVLGARLGLPLVLLGRGGESLAGERKTEPDVAGPVSIGYWLESEHLPRLDWQTAKDGLDPVNLPDVIDAELLPEGDLLFGGTGVRLHVHGLFPEPAPQSLPGRASIWLDVIYDAARPVGFRAWTLRGGRHPNLSSPLGVFVPIKDARGLGLSGQVRQSGSSQLLSPEPAGRSLQVRKPGKGGTSDPSSRSFALRLGLDVEPYVPKLRRGFYLLGFPSRLNGLPPDWSEVPSPIGSEDFSIVLLSVEYGDVQP